MSFEQMMQELIPMLMFWVAVLMILVGTPIYIIQSIGISKMARTRGIPNHWMGYIPVLRYYIYGGIADDVNRLTGKKNKNWKIILPIISAVYTSIQTFYMVKIFGMVEDMFRLMASMYDSASDAEMYSAAYSMIFSDPMYRFSSLWTLLSYGYFALILMVFYTIIKDYKPQSVTLYTVLSVFFRGISLHFFFIFANRNTVPISKGGNPYPNGYGPYPPGGGFYGEQGYYPPSYGAPYQQNPYGQGNGVPPEGYPPNVPPQGYTHNPYNNQNQ